MAHPTRTIFSPLVLALMTATLLTACADQADAPVAPATGVAIDAGAPASPTTSTPRGNGGEVANPRAKVVEEFRQRPTFAQDCVGLGAVSVRLAERMGCSAESIASARRLMATVQDDEIAQVAAELEQLAGELDASWNEALYLVDAAPGVPLHVVDCGARLGAAVGATLLATIDLAASGLALAHGNVPLATTFLQLARGTVPAAVTAVVTYMSSCRNGDGGGSGTGGRGYR